MKESNINPFEKKLTEIDSFLEEAKLLEELSLHSLSKEKSDFVIKRTEKQIDNYQKIINTLGDIKKNGFQGDLISFLEEKLGDKTMFMEEEDLYDLYNLVNDFVVGKNTRGSLDQLKKSIKNIRKEETSSRNLSKKDDGRIKEDGLEKDRLKEKQEDILINEILKTGKGGFYMSLPKELSPSNGGFTRVNDIGINISPTTTVWEEKMRKNKAVELIEFGLIKENITRKKVSTSAKKGFLGFGKRKEISQDEIVGERIKKFHELVEGFKKDESAYLFSYYFATGNFLRDYGDAYFDNSYKDCTHRRGQVLACNIYLPESLMNELKKNILKDDGIKLLRKLVKSYLEKKLEDNNINGFSAAWETGEKNGEIPLKPPYEYWDEKGLKPLFIENE